VRLRRQVKRMLMDGKRGVFVKADIVKAVEYMMATKAANGKNRFTPSRNTDDPVLRLRTLP
jgi:hypothetical protein